MQNRFLSLSFGFATCLCAASATSHASDLTMCELASATEQQRYQACERAQGSPSVSPRERARALLQLARLVQMRPDGLERAVKYLNTALAADPLFVPAILARAEWHVLSNEGHDAIKLLQPALTSHPEDIELVVMVGRAQFNALFFDRALDTFNEALKLDPTHVRALFESGRIHEITGNFRKAAEVFRRAGEKYDPNVIPESGMDIEHPNLMAARSYERLGEPAEALALVSSVIDRSPRHTARPDVFVQRASYYEALGRNDDAISDLTSALRIAGPNEHAPLLLKRALLYQKGGRREKAEEDLGKSLRIGNLRTVLRMQVYLRNQGYSEVEIDGVVGPAMLKSMTNCFAASDCSAGLGQPI